MRILVTAAGMQLPMELAQGLGAHHDVRLTDIGDRAAGGDYRHCDLGHDESTAELVGGMEAIVHCGQANPALSIEEQLDFCTRRTYNLLFAASQANVPMLVFLSSLSLMEKYPEDFLVTETWRPVPTTDMDLLCCHLGEFTCKEFVRENRITVVCLRLGEIVRGGEKPPSSSALHLDDALQAVGLAFAWDATRERTSGGRPPAPGAKGWGLFHIQSPIPGARFSTLSAQNLLDFKPTHKG